MNTKVDALKELLKSDTNKLGYYYDLVGDIIREESQEILMDLNNPNYDINETKENKKKLRKAFERVLKFYSNKEQWDSAVFEIYGKEGLNKKPYWGSANKVEIG